MLKSDSQTIWGKFLENNPQYHVTDNYMKQCHLLPDSCIDGFKQQTDIQKFFEAQNVLITGATGFLGKITLEKLLAANPGIGNIYVIIREKKGASANERLQELLNHSAFDRLKETVPNFKEKVIPVNGDCTLDKLGVPDDEYRRLSKTISIVIHGAATVKFNERLDAAALINLRGVEEILKFCKTCSNLKSCVHISTAYTNCTPKHTIIEEKFYAPGIDYKTILNLAKNNPSELVKKENNIISPWPNTYSFTKKLAEDLIEQEGVGLPISIFRPAIVISSYKEPLPLWNDNLFGPIAMILAGYLGIVRIVCIKGNSKANLVPVDYTVNSLIAIAWKTAQNFREGTKNIKIYNYVSEARNAITWKDFSDWNKNYGINWPSNLSMWYPFVIETNKKFVFEILFFLFQTVPGYVIDGISFILGQKRWMVKMHKKIITSLQLTDYFLNNSWSFKDSNTLELWNSLTPQDQRIYPFNISNVDWDEYIYYFLLGLRIHVVKDPLSTLPAAKRKFRRQLIVHYTFMGLIGPVCAGILYFAFKASW